MGKAISQLTDALAASEITNSGNIWFGVDNTGDGTSYKLKISELHKLTSHVSGAGSPSGVVTPEYIGQEYLDTSGSAWYKSTGLTNTDWQAL